MKPSSIAWERYEAKRGRPFPQEEKCHLDVVDLLSEALRVLVRPREEYLVAYLDGTDPQRIQELGKAVVDATDEARAMQAYETDVYGIDFLKKG